jgi:RNA 3'-terminal phosphate cyclase (ATP)
MMEMRDLIQIDGSEGEGGGQILRTALALSMVTGRPFEIVNLRANRPKPGLRPQHLVCVEAAAKVCSATTEGAKVNSRTVRFEPGTIRPGTYQFDIRTAGATSLVLQTLYLPLAVGCAPSPAVSDPDALTLSPSHTPTLRPPAGRSIVSITGGTHVPFSPSFHFLMDQWAVFLRRLGMDIELTLERSGYYPEGGGQIRAKIRPITALRPLTLGPRGRLERLEGISTVSNLPRTIAERQRQRALECLDAAGFAAGMELVELPSPGKGTMVHLFCVHEGGGRACYDALGALGKRAETVAEEACEGMIGFLRTQGALDERLADQLLLPLSLASGPSEFPVPAVTNHLLTNARTIERFLPCSIRIEGEIGQEAMVRVSPGTFIP